MKSKTFEQAETFHENNKERLLEIMFDEFDGDIDYQPEYDQVAVWFAGFSLCYQSSDMNGDGKGEAHWNNCGADSGIGELGDILEKDERFQALIVKEEYYGMKHTSYLEDFIDEFCAEYAEKYNIAAYFSCNN